MPDPRPVRASLGAVLWVFAGLTLLATCAEPVTQDYTQRYPLAARPETVSMPAHYVGTADPFAGEARESFDTLVQGYLDRGHGPITVAAPAPFRGANPNQAHMEQVRQRLIAAGIPASAIQLMLTSEGAPNTVTISYERYTAVLPTCGDWSSPMDFNPINTAYPNFGCAQQRNLGLMVADPADLVSMHPAQPSDAANTERVIKDYRNIVPSTTPVATETLKNGIESSADLNAASGASVGQNSGGGASTR